MKTTLPFVVALCLLAWSSTSLAGVIPPDLSGPPDDWELPSNGITIATGHLEYWIETDKAVYMPGEQVRVVQGVRYVPGDPNGLLALGLGVIFPSEPRFEHYIFSSDGERIDRAVTVRFLSYQTVMLWPGDSVSDEWVWDLTDSDGNPVPPGTYDIYGGDSWVASKADHVAHITVVPEPASLMAMLGALSGLLLRRRRPGG